MSSGRGPQPRYEPYPQQGYQAGDDRTAVLYSLGYRYRLHHKDLPSSPDIVFAGQRKVIFVHSCFWHAHGCKVSHRPKSNGAYWSPKLQRNVDRSTAANAELQALGWTAEIVWECEIKNGMENLEAKLRAFLG